MAAAAITLFLTRPHCSSAVSTRRLSENNFIMLEDRVGFDWVDPKPVQMFRKCDVFCSLLHGNFALLVHLQLQLGVSETNRQEVTRKFGNAHLTGRCGLLRFEEVAVSCCIVGKDVCCQTEELVCPKLGQKNKNHFFKKGICLFIGFDLMFVLEVEKEGCSFTLASSSDIAWKLR